MCGGADVGPLQQSLTGNVGCVKRTVHNQRVNFIPGAFHAPYGLRTHLLCGGADVRTAPTKFSSFTREGSNNHATSFVLILAALSLALSAGTAGAASFFYDMSATDGNLQAWPTGVRRPGA